MPSIVPGVGLVPIKLLSSSHIDARLNSKDLECVPLELGMDDASLSQGNVVIFPTSDTSYYQDWARQEYLGLYRHIVWGPLGRQDEAVWMVYDYRTKSGMLLSTWCRSRTGY